MSVIGNKFDALMNWVEKGDSVLGGTFKMMGVILVALGVVLAPIIAAVNYVSNANVRAYKKTIKDIDSGRSLIFNSAAECLEIKNDHNFCKVSKEKAIDWARSLGTDVEYSNLGTCQSNHGHCESETTIIPVTTMVGKVPVTNYVTTTTHSPLLVAWQAAQYDAHKSVPLYNTADKNVAVRADSQTFNIK